MHESFAALLDAVMVMCPAPRSDCNKRKHVKAKVRAAQQKRTKANLLTSAENPRGDPGVCLLMS